MAEYNPMNVAGVEEEKLAETTDSATTAPAEDEALELELDDDERLSAPPEKEKEKSKDKPEEKTTNSSETVGLLMVVWVVIIIAVVVVIASKVISSKKTDSKPVVSDQDVQQVIVNSSMMDIENLAAGSDTFKDTIKIKHAVEVTGTSVSMYFYGTSEDNGVVYIPVQDLEDFNAVEDGDSVEYTYSQLKISGELKLIVRGWTIK